MSSGHGPEDVGGDDDDPEELTSVGPASCEPDEPDDIEATSDGEGGDAVGRGGSTEPSSLPPPLHATSELAHEKIAAHDAIKKGERALSGRRL